jgi:methylenetetrahydrofolate--tRNA-(uracil-5-)-methyltransferase
MNVNFGLFPPPSIAPELGKRVRGAERGAAKRRAISARALVDLERWLAGPAAEAAE